MQNAIVETRYGKVEGLKQGAVKIWKGIPFAQPPVGSLRFCAPQKLQEWSGVRDATHLGPNSAQLNDIIGSFFNGPSSSPPSGEDCLYLNIWSPDADQKKRPVLVWIHGGAFVTGSGAEPWTDGASFARHGDVVVVSINYRLGALGFLYLGDLDGVDYPASGVCGLLDQIAALEWVRDNIEAFGGDPANVTVAGESAGAMSVGTLLAMPQAQGLFQRAILESGAGHDVLTRTSATRMTHTFLSHLGLKVDQASELATVPLEQILEAQKQCISGMRGFAPVIDGFYLSGSPVQQIANGSSSAVSLLIGTNRDEARLFALMSNGLNPVDHDALKRLFGAASQEVLTTYTQAREDKSAEGAWSDIITDRVFRIPAIRLVESQVQYNAAVWMYRFDWVTSAFGGNLGACHSLEIPFAWNTINTELALMFTGDAPTRQPLAQRMHDAWIAFIRTGSPAIAELPAWPTYDVSQRATMLLNDHCQLVNDPQGTERRFWAYIL
jgi:para-nitrobenzyl esterase